MVNGGNISVVEIDGAASRMVATIADIEGPRTLNVDAGGDFAFGGGLYGGAENPAIYVIHAPSNSVVRVVSLDSSQRYPNAAYLSSADSVLYVTAGRAVLTYWHTGSV